MPLRPKLSLYQYIHNSCTSSPGIYGILNPKGLGCNIRGFINTIYPHWTRRITSLEHSIVYSYLALSNMQLLRLKHYPIGWSTYRFRAGRWACRARFSLVTVTAYLVTTITLDQRAVLGDGLGGDSNSRLRADNARSGCFVSRAESCLIYVLSGTCGYHCLLESTS